MELSWSLSSLPIFSSRSQSTILKRVFFQCLWITSVQDDVFVLCWLPPPRTAVPGEIQQCCELLTPLYVKVASPLLFVYCCLCTAGCVLLFLCIVSCVLLVVYCWLCTAVCVLLVVYCWLCTIGCVLLFMYCWLCTAIYVLLVVYCYLCIVGCVLQFVYCWLYSLGWLPISNRSHH